MREDIEVRIRIVGGKIHPLAITVDNNNYKVGLSIGKDKVTAGVFKRENRDVVEVFTFDFDSEVLFGSDDK